MNLTKLLQILMHARLTRYGLAVAGGVLIGSWTGQYYPAQSAALWGMPAAKLFAAGMSIISAYWLSQHKEAKDAIASDDRAASAFENGLAVNQGTDAKK